MMYSTIVLCRNYLRIVRFYYVYFGQINESVCLSVNSGTQPLLLLGNSYNKAYIKWITKHQMRNVVVEVTRLKSI